MLEEKFCCLLLQNIEEKKNRQWLLLMGVQIIIYVYITYFYENAYI